MLQRLPTCVPLFPVPLEKRMPLTDPLMSDLNLTPSSKGPGSLTDALPGVVVDCQLEHGQFEPVPVVNVHVTSAATALPATSFAPAAPPFMVAVYAVETARAFVGVSVAVR